MKHSDRLKLHTLKRRVAKLRERLWIENNKLERLLWRQKALEDIRDMELSRIHIQMSVSCLEAF